MSESVVHATPAPLSSTEQKEIKECFDYFDRDRDGCLSESEFTTVLRSLGALVSKADLDTYTGSEKFPISWSRFLPIASIKVRQGYEALDNEVLRAFQVFDVRGRGKIAISDLRKFLTTLGEEFREEDLDEALKYANISTNQLELSYPEFLQTIKGSAVGKKSIK